MTDNLPRHTCDTDGCRKRATHAILYRYHWGQQITGKGSVDCWLQDVKWRCPSHLEVDNKIATRELKTGVVTEHV